MKSRWLVNVLLLLVVLSIGAFIKFRPQQEVVKETAYEVSSLKLSTFTKVSVEFPAKAPVAVEKVIKELGAFFTEISGPDIFYQA